jgi:hypothetical protein
MEIFSSDQTDTGEYRCTASNIAGHVEKTELNISRSDYSPCTSNDSVFSTLPAILEAVHLYSPVSVQSELNISRGDNSPCTNNETVFSTLPAIFSPGNI